MSLRSDLPVRVCSRKPYSSGFYLCDLSHRHFFPSLDGEEVAAGDTEFVESDDDDFADSSDLLPRVAKIDGALVPFRIELS